MILSDSPAWLQEAWSRFPELASEFEMYEMELPDTPYMLWFELCSLFDKAYDEDNLDLVKRIYDYRLWCFEQPEGKTAEDDLGSCVAVCFYEHIPQHPKAMADMPRWFPREHVVDMKATFSYMVGEDRFQRILDVYDEHDRASSNSKKKSKKKRK
jgi:hypothetical protein